jgi:hypothetical protein
MKIVRDLFSEPDGNGAPARALRPREWSPWPCDSALLTNCLSAASRLGAADTNGRAQFGLRSSINPLLSDRAETHRERFPTAFR